MKILEFLTVTHIPYQIINKENATLTLPSEIKKIALTRLNRIYLFTLSDSIFWGLLNLNKTQNLLIGPVTTHRMYDIEPLKFFSYLHSSKEFTSLKRAIDASALTDKKSFIKLLEMVSLEINHHNQIIKEKIVNTPLTINFNGDINSEDSMKQIVSAIKHGDIARIYLLLNDPLLTANSKISNLDLTKKDLQYFYFSTIARIASYAQDVGVSQQICDQITKEYTIAWNKANLTSSQIGQLIVQAMISFALECRKQLFFPDNDPILRQVLRYVSNHQEEKISRKLIAQNLNLSPSYLSHYFNLKTKMTITEFINRYKVNQAQYLLKTSSLSIIQISESLGFSTVPYFNRVFKKICGKTPNQYRIQALKIDKNSI